MRLQVLSKIQFRGAPGHEGLDFVRRDAALCLKPKLLNREL